MWKVWDITAFPLTMGTREENFKQRKDVELFTSLSSTNHLLMKESSLLDFTSSLLVHVDQEEDLEEMESEVTKEMMA